jgi:hypothetical protein
VSGLYGGRAWRLLSREFSSFLVFAPSEVVAMLEIRLTDRSGAFKFNFRSAIASQNQTTSINSLFHGSLPIKKM